MQDLFLILFSLLVTLVYSNSAIRDEFGCLPADRMCKLVHTISNDSFYLGSLKKEEMSGKGPTIHLNYSMPSMMDYENSEYRKDITSSIEFNVNITNNVYPAGNIRYQTLKSPVRRNVIDGGLIFATYPISQANINSPNYEVSKVPLDRMTITANGNIGVGVMDPLYPFHVRGTDALQSTIGVYSENAVLGSNFYRRADRREFKNVNAADPEIALQRLASLQLRNYEIASDDSGKTYTGILGQEVRHIIPGAVKAVEGINIQDGTGQLKLVDDFNFLDDTLILSTTVGATQALYAILLKLQENANTVTHEVISLKQTANSTETEYARGRAAKAEMEAMAFQLEARKAIANAEADAIQREMESRRAAAEAENILAKQQTELMMLQVDKIKADALIDQAVAKTAESNAIIAVETTRQLGLKAAIAEWESQKGSLAASTADAEARKMEAAATIEIEKTKQLVEQRGLLEDQIRLNHEIRLTAEANAKAAESNAMSEKAKEQTALHVEIAQLAEVEANKLKLDAENVVLQSAEIKLERELARIKAERQQAEFEDQLIRQRTSETLIQQDDSFTRQELLKLETLKAEHAMELEKERLRIIGDKEAKIAAVQTEGQIRILQERDNEDIATRRQTAALQAEHARVIESIQVGLSSFGSGIINFMGDKEKLIKVVGLIVSLAVGIYFAKEGSSLVRQEIQRRLGKPSLVRETTSTTGHFSLFKRFIRWWKNEDPMTVFKDVVLSADLEVRVKKLAKATRNARLNGAPFRHTLFYGPPGTGKTMVAKRLAWQSGMEYAIMSGGDVGPLGSDAVTELHRLFEWAKKSSRGLLLFIDEAECFLGNRNKSDMSENLRNALNALLFQTGEQGQSLHFMLVLATNRPGDLDKAITDRIDETLEFKLPELSSRSRLVQQYFTQFVSPVEFPAEPAAEDSPTFNDSLNNKKKVKAKPKKLSVSDKKDEKISIINKFFSLMQKKTPPIELLDIDTSHIDDIALLTEGFSGREIEKIMIAIQGSVYGSDSLKLSSDLLMQEVKYKVAEHAGKIKIALDKKAF